MNKKILIVTKAFFPENSPRSHRATELAKAFSRMGHKVKVICPRIDPEHSQFEKDQNLQIADLGPIRWKPIALTGTGLLYWVRRLVKRFTNLLIVYPDIELLWLTRKALRNEKNYDLLISVAVPFSIHWGVAWARTAKHRIATTWIADCGDPFMGQENDTFKYPFYFKYVEKWFSRKTDFLTVPTEGAIQGYYPEFHQKIKVIPQGFNFEEKFPEVQSVRNGRKIAFAYAGMFIPGRRDPREFLKYLLETSSDFEFHIFTASSALVKPFVDRDDQKRIILHPVISRNELLAQLNNMDFVVNFENIGSKQTPSKLVDYVIVQKPILSIKTGSLQTSIVAEFLEGNYENQYRVQNPEQYKIGEVSKRFLDLLQA
jgi:hypothetical protein